MRDADEQIKYLSDQLQLEREESHRRWHAAHLWSVVRELLVDAGCPLDTTCHVPTVVGKFLSSRPASQDVLCRGSWRLGTACGDCRRCTESLLRLIAEFVDDEPCRYDHHGYCQSHSLAEKPCPHETAKHVLTTATKRLKFKIDR